MSRYRTGSRVAARFVGLAFTVSVTCQAGQVLYGINQSDQLLRIDTSTGASSVVGALSSSMNAIGLAQTGGNLYAVDSNNNVLRELNTITAATFATIAVGFTLSDALGEGDLAFDNSGEGYLASSLRANGDFGGGSLFTLDLGASSHAIAKDPADQQYNGLAFNPLTNKLYGILMDGSMLYVIDTATHTETLVGATGISNGSIVYGGLSFRGDGTLFATLGDDSSHSLLYTIDTATGAATLVGDTGGTAITGIAFVGTVDTPEPSTGLMMLALPLLVAGTRRFRRNHV